MTSAGRILIMPKGNYDSSATYEMLDLVYYNGTSWLAKKTVTGIEPSAANSEYWQQMSDFSFLEERKQERVEQRITVPINSSYTYTLGFKECCLLFVYADTMDYSCIFACSGQNEWVYSINKLSEAYHTGKLMAEIGTEPGNDINQITFINETDSDRVLTFIKLPLL